MDDLIVYFKRNTKGIYTIYLKANVEEVYKILLEKEFILINGSIFRCIDIISVENIDTIIKPKS